MLNDPKVLADQLLNEHGPNEALSIADNNKHEANRNGDYYGLSIWREVSGIIKRSADPLDSD